MRLVGNVEEDGAVALLGAVADQLASPAVTLQQRRQQLGHKGLAEHLGERHLGEQRDEPRNESRILRCLDDQRQLHGWSGHLDCRLRGSRTCAPSTMSAQWISSATGAVSNPKRVGGDVRDKAGAGSEIGIAKLVIAAGRILLAGQIILLVLGRKEGRQMMVKPPRDPGRGGVFEVDDGVLVAVKFALVKERAGAVQQAVILIAGPWCDALTVKAREQRG